MSTTLSTASGLAIHVPPVRSRRAGLWAGLLCGCIAVSSCNSNTPTSPTTTTPVSVTDVFSGTVNRNGANSHSFTVASSGTVTATLSSVTPDSALVLGFALGTWNGTGCQVVIASDKAAQGTNVVGTASTAGSLCVRIYDVGNVVDPVSYEVQVVHY
ncbi:MAG: hypothetical protein U0Q12_26920 [Vicinamibacterales bacterium]